MAISAAIRFVQGVTVGAVGQALFGETGAVVTVSNGTNDNVSAWTFEVLDSPPGSVVTPGIKQSGPLPTWAFTPDVDYGYLIKVTVADVNGNTSEDIRCFGVKDASNYFIAPAGAKASALNFGGQLRGWSPYMEKWLKLATGSVAGLVQLAGDLAGDALTPIVRSLTGEDDIVNVKAILRGDATAGDPLRFGRTNVNYTADADKEVSNVNFANFWLRVTSSLPLTTSRILTVPTVAEWSKIIENDTSGGQDISIVTGAGGEPVIIPNGCFAFVTCEGDDLRGIVFPQGHGIYSIIARSGIVTITTNATVYQINASYGMIRVEIAHTTTTNATPSTQLTYAMPSNSTALVVARAIAHRTDNAASRVFRHERGFRNAAGVITSFTNTPLDNGDAAASTATLTLDASGSSLRAQVTGIAATTFKWAVTWEIFLGRNFV